MWGMENKIWLCRTLIIAIRKTQHHNTTARQAMIEASGITGIGSSMADLFIPLVEDANTTLAFCKQILKYSDGFPEICPDVKTLRAFIDKELSLTE